MRRAIVGVAIIAGSLIPACVATVWLFGCCVLPFHRVLHRLVPLCRIAIAHDSEKTDQQPSKQPESKPRPAQRLATELTAMFGVPFAPQTFPATLSSAAAYRSFITLGAVRCDQDVGLHTLFATFLI